MVLEPRGHEYPKQGFHVIPFPAKFDDVFPQPKGLVEDIWPPDQLNYLCEYLSDLRCKSIVVEDHYVDRDYVSDVALFYARSLRAYPNYCQRLHFFATRLDEARWRVLVTQARQKQREKAHHALQEAYLGFLVVRPLPGSPVGRTVVALPNLRTLPRGAPENSRHDFAATRDHAVHLAGFELRVGGVAFQQQDQGVSACATTALWSALNHVTGEEGLAVPTPAEITVAASRYLLVEGRSLPSEGLTADQICEATRAAGLSPVLVRSASLAHDRAQLLGYIDSGFPAVLAVQSVDSGIGHAVCAVGVELGEVAPQTHPNLHFRDAATAVRGVYVHDDRLGPYAFAEIGGHTDPRSSTVRTLLRIKWPGRRVEFESCMLMALVVPVPAKLRLTVARMRLLGQDIAEATGLAHPDFGGRVTMNCRYRRGTEYQKSSPEFGLSSTGLYALLCETILSRYIGVIEILAPDGKLFDVVLDATETRANPAVLCCIRRSPLSSRAERQVKAITRQLGASWIT